MIGLITIRELERGHSHTFRGLTYGMYSLEGLYLSTIYKFRNRTSRSKYI